MFCWRARGRLSAFLDGELRPEAAKALDAHLAGCARCAATMGRLRSAWEEVRSLPAPPASGDLWPGVLRKLAGGTEPGRIPVSRRFLVPATVAAGCLLGVALGTAFALRVRPYAAGRTVPRVESTGGDAFAEAFADLPGDRATSGSLAWLSGSPGNGTVDGPAPARRP